jgi:hypothetical protein
MSNYRLTDVSSTAVSLHQCVDTENAAFWLFFSVSSLDTV